MRNEGVQLVGRVLILISESGQADADPVGDVSEKRKNHLGYSSESRI